VGAENAGGEIGDAAGRGRDDELERSCRIAFGECGPATGGNECGQDRKRTDHVHSLPFDDDFGKPRCLHRLQRLRA
jgi:hypothetical protein